MKLNLILSLVIFSQVAIAQRDEKGLLPPPLFIPEEDSSEVEKINSKDVKLKSKMPEAAVIGKEYQFDVPQYQVRDGKSKRGLEVKQEHLKYVDEEKRARKKEFEESLMRNGFPVDGSTYKKEQDDTMAGCTLSPDALEINCPFGNFKKDPSTDNSSLRQNTKTDLPSASPKKTKKSGSKATAQ